jgi:hypothetical protein
MRSWPCHAWPGKRTASFQFMLRIARLRLRLAPVQSVLSEFTLPEDVVLTRPVDALASQVKALVEQLNAFFGLRSFTRRRPTTSGSLSESLTTSLANRHPPPLRPSQLHAKKAHPILRERASARDRLINFLLRFRDSCVTVFIKQAVGLWTGLLRRLNRCE